MMIGVSLQQQYFRRMKRHWQLSQWRRNVHKSHHQPEKYKQNNQYDIYDERVVSCEHARKWTEEVQGGVHARFKQ